MSPTAALCVFVAIFFLCIVNVHSFIGGGGDVHGGGGRFDGSLDVQAVFNRGGVTGNVHFSQRRPGSPVSIQVNLMCLDQFNTNMRLEWSIHEYPIRSSLLRNFPCSDQHVGGVLNTGQDCTNNQCSVGDLTSIVGPLRSDQQFQSFVTNNITLYGSESIIGRSLVIDKEGGPAGGFTCSNIEQLGGNLEILRAPFNNGVIQGDVIFRYVEGRDDATIEVDLYRIDVGGNQNSDGHEWTLNFGAAGPDNSCDEVDTVFGSEVGTSIGCSMSNQRECPIGGLTLKCGTLSFVNGRARSFCSDNQLGSTPRTYLFDELIPKNRLSVVIGEESQGGGILGCAALEMIAPLTARSQFRTNIIAGNFRFWQSGPDDRTNIQVHLTGLNPNENYSLRIFTNPAPMSMTTACDNLGGVFVRNGARITSPASVNPNCPGTHDSCITGNLDALLPLEMGDTSLRTTVSSSTLPLFGPYTIVNRSIGLVLESTNQVIACSTIMLEQDYPQGQLASILGYQDLNNPPIPDFS